MYSLVSFVMTIGVVLFILGCFLGPMFRGTVRGLGGMLIGAALLLGIILAQALLWVIILVAIFVIVAAVMLLRWLFRRPRW